ncbi:MAG TPA: sigma-54 dependent transcriptional regulator, partial [Nitrospiria bacterium]|nr:sigma-54 dependent transcriptional regulator [Nitrospiria bacterium]
MKTGNVLVVDDEKSQRDIVKTILKSADYDVETAANGQQAGELYRTGNFDVVLTDLKLPDTDGLSIVDQMFQIQPLGCLIIMTAHGSIDSAVEAMKKGAFDYLTKPLDRDQILIVLKRAFEKVQLLKENRLLHQQLEERFSLDNIIGHHNKMQELFQIIKKISTSDVTVLICGESGTGKELIARAIHFNSQRKHKPFMAINCAAIPEPLIDSELFGYEKGAFTGAAIRRIGLFEATDKGTLFLDEIGDLSLALQAKLLRTLQEREVRRLGGREQIKIDVRVIAATNKQLEAEIRNGNFREDLFYRLNVMAIQVPPLRERSTDIPALVEHFIQKYTSKVVKSVKEISHEAMRFLMEYSWPGNVRQLESVIERVILLCETDRIELVDLPSEIKTGPVPITGF